MGVRVADVCILQQMAQVLVAIRTGLSRDTAVWFKTVANQLTAKLKLDFSNGSAYNFRAILQ
jgi:hypothetical protein